MGGRPCLIFRRPSLSASEVGIREKLFRGLFGVHVVTARLLAESPSCDPLSSKASADLLPPRLFRLLPGGTINLPDGTCTRWKTTPLHGALAVTFSDLGKLVTPGNSPSLFSNSPSIAHSVLRVVPIATYSQMTAWECDSETSTAGYGDAEIAVSRSTSRNIDLLQSV